MPNET